MTRWDRRSAAEQAKVADRALVEQVRGRLARYQPYWRETVRGTGLRANEITSVADLAKVPPVGERDLCPDGDPADAARLVLGADESAFAMHVSGAHLRRAMLRRLVSPARYRRMVDDAVRPVVFHQGGLGLRFPVASTRGDLDVVARAGARTWQVLGLTASDVLVSAVPPGDARSDVFALSYAALGAGAPAQHAGPATAADSLDALPATVVAVRDAAGLDTLLEQRGDLLPETVHTVVVTGDPDGVAELAGDVRVLRAWAPAEGRWLWAQCAPGSGLHTYPDLEVVETLDPASGSTASEGELAVTQLGVFGSALARWRTGAVHGGAQTGACPQCGRTVPRVAPDVRAAALVTPAEVAGDAVLLDLRAVGGALAGRADVAGWVVGVDDNPSGGAPLVLVRIAVDDPADAADVALGVYADIERTAGTGPTQVALDPDVRGRRSLLAV